MDFDSNIPLSNIPSGNDAFGKGSNDNIGKSDSMIGKSNGFGDKSGTGRSSLNSLYDQAHKMRAAREMKAVEPANLKHAQDAPADKPEKGALEFSASISVRQAVKKTVEIMDKKKAFDVYLTPGQQTLKNKISVAKRLINEIEGKDVGWSSYVHRTKANDTARRVLSKGVTEIGGLKKRDNVTSMKAYKAIGGTIGELTRNKDIMRRSNRT